MEIEICNLKNNNKMNTNTVTIQIKKQNIKGFILVFTYFFWLCLQHAGS